MGRGSGKKGKNLNELKQELEIDVHRVSVDELCKRFNSNVAEGLTDDQVAKGIEEHGLNQLTPPKTTPEWVRICHAPLVWGDPLLFGLWHPGERLRGATGRQPLPRNCAQRCRHCHRRLFLLPGGKVC